MSLISIQAGDNEEGDESYLTTYNSENDGEDDSEEDTYILHSPT